MDTSIKFIELLAWLDKSERESNEVFEYVLSLGKEDRKLYFESCGFSKAQILSLNPMCEQPKERKAMELVPFGNKEALTKAVEKLTAGFYASADGSKMPKVGDKVTFCNRNKNLPAEVTQVGYLLTEGKYVARVKYFDTTYTGNNKQTEKDANGKVVSGIWRYNEFVDLTDTLMSAKTEEVLRSAYAEEPIPSVSSNKEQQKASSESDAAFAAFKEDSKDSKKSKAASKAA
jgi:tyrosyl-tRNA synthetase